MYAKAPDSRSQASCSSSRHTMGGNVGSLQAGDVIRGTLAAMAQYWLLLAVLLTAACSLHLFHWEAHDKTVLAQHPINYSDPSESYWGPPTAAIDWCEDNYRWTRYIAEFWNTLTSMLLLLAGVIGFRESARNGLEPRFLMCYASLAVVGLGSVLFHATLKYELQMADELPMLWASLVWMYVLINNECVDGERYVRWPVLAAYGAFATILFIYITEELPAVFQMHILVQSVWAVHNVCQMLSSLGDQPAHDPAKRIFTVYGVVGMIGFFCWIVENATCSKMAQAGLHPQLHAWWHTCMSINTYIGPMFVAYKRGLNLGKRPVVTLSYGIPSVHYLREVKTQ